MNTMLLRLIGPMQSWGVQSRFSVRDSGLEPSKSGVIGLLCAALGRGREEPLDDLAALKMGIRADREGRLSRDFHVAGNDGYLKAGGAIERKNVIPSNRYFLADAAFLVGLESMDLELLQTLHAALEHPVWMLYLGRKAFEPADPIFLKDGLQMGIPLEKALETYPFLGRGQPPDRLRAVIEDTTGDQIRPDQPISFSARRFAPRRVRTVYIEPPVQMIQTADNGEVS